MSSGLEPSYLHNGTSQIQLHTEDKAAAPALPSLTDPDPQLPLSNGTDGRQNQTDNSVNSEPFNAETEMSDAKPVNDETEDSTDAEQVNDDAEDSVNAKQATDETEHSRDAQTVNDEAVDLRDTEPVSDDADGSHVAQTVNDEDSNSTREEEITNELSNADLRVEQSNQEGDSDSKLGNPEGNRTFTMRELLSNLQNGDANENDERETDTPHSQAISEQQIALDNAAMDLINSVSVSDEEGRSRQRILTFAAKRYATALERNPGDYDALYNWALVLQESADNVNPESTSPSKDALLEEACRKYEEAVRLCPTLNDAYYNLAIAISDRAKMRGRTREAEELWKQATKNYEKAVQLNWNSPQALNNWGLALQELSGIVPAREKQHIVKTAISKFRAAIQLQFDFHRAIYNLGTVLYGLAEDISRAGGYVNTKDISPDELYSQSAVYIAAAHALKPSYSVYSSALKLVRSMLPLPYLKVGYLTAPPAGISVAPHCDWKPSQFVLSHEGLQQITNVDDRLSSPSLSSNTSDMPAGNSAIRVDVPDIVSASPCADLTLPPGAGLCIDTIHGPVYLVADSWESLDRWIDAIRLVYTIYARGKRDVLAGIIAS